MPIHFVFSQDAVEATRPEEIFADQWATLQAAGFTASLCSDEVLSGAKALRRVPSESHVVYRGWMVKAQEYAALIEAIHRCGAKPFTSLQEYLAAHHLPNWYPLLEDLTPETRVFSADVNIVAELRALDWGAYFIKDYVKSLKTARGSIVRKPAEAPSLIAEMREYRGEIEGGICVRRVEEFVPKSEQRYFVLLGKGYAATEDAEVPEVVGNCAERLSSKFFSVDVVRRADGPLRIVEVGDGQVSDLVGWSPQAFANMWARGCRG